MKTLNIIQNATLSIITLFVLTSISRVMVHIGQTQHFQFSHIISFGFALAVIGVVGYIMVAILIGLWKESINR